jgi:hypothetical protein
MAYRPTDPPEEYSSDYLISELRLVSKEFEGVEFVQLPTLHNPPERPRDGMVVLADGSDWDPGSGAGFYGRSAGAWVFLG